MRSRWAEPSEKQALQALWKLCFGDDHAVTDRFFSIFPPQYHTRVILIERKIAAMASWMPVTLCANGRQYAGAYLYAVATRPDFRGQGLCRVLMAELEAALWERSMCFTALSPAEASLYDFYGTMGYEKAFTCHVSRILPLAKAAIEYTEISPADYQKLRERWLLEPYCRWDALALSYLAAEVHFFRVTDGGCAAASILPDGGIRILERLQCDAAALCYALHGSYASVTEPGETALHGMIKWNNLPQNVRNAYLGFAFD